MVSILDFSALQKAIQSLHEAIEIISNHKWFNEQPSAVQNTLIAGAIKNFEFVYELSMKMLRRQLEWEADNPTEIDETGFKDLLRMAAEKGLIENVERWFAYRTMRNITSHTYDHEKAQRVYEDTLTFIKDAKILLENLENRNASTQN